MARRAQAAGYGALVLTVDVPIIGQRERDLRNGMTLPPRVTRSNAFDTLGHPGWLLGLTRGGPLTFANFVGVPGRGHGVVELGRYVNVEMMNPGALGEPGVDRVLEILRTELDRALALVGVPDVRQLDRSVIGPVGSVGTAGWSGLACVD